MERIDKTKALISTFLGNDGRAVTECYNEASTVSTGCSLMPARQLSRRASQVEVPQGSDSRRDLLVVPSQRSRGVSLPDSISSTDLYRLR